MMFANMGLVLVAQLCVLGSEALVQPAAAKRPNFVFVLTDDQVHLHDCALKKLPCIMTISRAHTRSGPPTRKHASYGIHENRDPSQRCKPVQLLYPHSYLLPIPFHVCHGTFRPQQQG